MEEKITLSQDLLEEVDSLLQEANIEEIVNQNNDFKELPEGYYLSEVEDAKLTTTKVSNLPMIAFTFKIVEKGWTFEPDENANPILTQINENITKRKFFINYVLKDQTSVKRYVTDMLKFEGENHDPLLSAEYFTNSAILLDTLDLLKGMRIYINITSTMDDNDQLKYWKNLCSWNKIRKIGLPE